MQQATITSKRQLTIPINIFKKANLKSNSKVIIEYTKGGILIKPSTDIVESLAASVDIPKSKKGVSSEIAIEEAKKLRFSK